MDVSGLLKQVEKSFHLVIAKIETFLPTLFLFFLVVFLSFVLAYLFKKIVQKILKKINTLLVRISNKAHLRTLQLPDKSIKTISNLVFWLLFSFFFLLGLNLSDLSRLNLYNKVLYYFPNIFAAGFILFIGWALGLYVQRSLEYFYIREDIKQGFYISETVKWLILIIFIDLALTQIGFSTALFTNLILILVAAFSAGLMLAFALGAKDFVGNLILSRTLQLHYAPGQKIKFDKVEGTIQRFTSTAVIILTPKGEVMVPASKFAQEPSLKMHQSEK